MQMEHRGPYLDTYYVHLKNKEEWVEGPSDFAKSGLPIHSWNKQIRLQQPYNIGRGCINKHRGQGERSFRNSLFTSRFLLFKIQLLCSLTANNTAPCRSDAEGGGLLTHACSIHTPLS